jgi:hypothetical protein
MKDVYTIIEAGKEGTRKEDFWVRVGVAFENKDGSLNVKLNALPVNGTLHIRDRKEDESGEAKERAASKSTGFVGQ